MTTLINYDDVLHAPTPNVRPHTSPDDGRAGDANRKMTSPLIARPSAPAPPPPSPSPPPSPPWCFTWCRSRVQRRIEDNSANSHTTVPLCLVVISARYSFSCRNNMSRILIMLRAWVVKTTHKPVLRDCHECERGQRPAGTQSKEALD